MERLLKLVKRTVLLMGAVGTTACAPVERIISSIRLTHDDPTHPGVRFELNPGEYHTLYVGGMAVGHEIRRNGELVYEGACGMVEDPRSPDTDNSQLGCIKIAYP